MSVEKVPIYVNLLFRVFIYPSINPPKDPDFIIASVLVTVFDVCKNVKAGLPKLVFVNVFGSLIVCTVVKVVLLFVLFTSTSNVIAPNPRYCIPILNTFPVAQFAKTPDGFDIPPTPERLSAFQMDCDINCVVGSAEFRVDEMLPVDPVVLKVIEYVPLLYVANESLETNTTVFEADV